MAPENKSTLTDAECNVIQGLWDRGFCVVIWTPEQVGEADAAELEEVVISAANFTMDVRHD